MNHFICSYKSAGQTLHTVIYKDRDGDHDMSAQNPCETVEDLCDFIGELHAEGFITETERDALLADCEGLDR